MFYTTGHLLITLTSFSDFNLVHSWLLFCVLVLYFYSASWCCLLKGDSTQFRYLLCCIDNKDSSDSDRLIDWPIDPDPQIPLTSKATRSRLVWLAWCPGWITSSRSSPATSWAAASPACRLTPSAHSKQVRGRLFSQSESGHLCRRRVEPECRRTTGSLLTSDSRAGVEEKSSWLELKSWQSRTLLKQRA